MSSASSRPPVATDAATATRMRNVRRQGTSAELNLRRELFRRGVRYRLQAPVVPEHPRRTVDIVVLGPRIAVFVDGCFWHGCREHRTVPKANRAWWVAKIDRIRARDAQTTEVLEQAGWRVVRVWEHEDPGLAAARVSALVPRRGS